MSTSDCLLSADLLEHYRSNILPRCDQTVIRRNDFLPHYAARSYPLFMGDNFKKLSQQRQSTTTASTATDDGESDTRGAQGINRILSEYILHAENASKYEYVTDAFELIDDDHCVIGEGTYGVVFRAYSKPRGKDVAIKAIRCDDGYVYAMDVAAENTAAAAGGGRNQSSSSSSSSSSSLMDHNSFGGTCGDRSKTPHKTSYKSAVAAKHSHFISPKLTIKKNKRQWNDQIGIPHTAIQELQILQRLQHKNIVNLIDVVSNRSFDIIPNVSAQRYLQLLHKIWNDSSKYRDKYPQYTLPNVPSDVRDETEKEKLSQSLIRQIFSDLHETDVQLLEDDSRDFLNDAFEQVHARRCKDGSKCIPVFYMVFEFMDRDLSSLIKSCQTQHLRLKEGVAKYFFTQILQGIRHCHQCGIIHRDIKPSNVLINYSGEVKLCDFGLAFENYSTHSSTAKTNRVVTTWYRPPEILLGATRYSYAVDIWSCACVFLEMLTTCSPFQSQDELDLFRQIINLCGRPTTTSSSSDTVGGADGDENSERTRWDDVHTLPWYQAMMQHLNKAKPPASTSSEETALFYNYRRCILSDPFLRYHLHDDALDFMDFMLILDPKRRPTADEILCHRYFRCDPKPEYVEIDNGHKIDLEKVDKLLTEKRQNVRKQRKDTRATSNDRDMNAKSSNADDTRDDARHDNIGGERGDRSYRADNMRDRRNDFGEYQYQSNASRMPNDRWNNNNNNDRWNNNDNRTSFQSEYNYNSNNNGYGANRFNGNGRDYRGGGGGGYQNNNNNNSYNHNNNNNNNDGYGRNQNYQAPYQNYPRGGGNGGGRGYGRGRGRGNYNNNQRVSPRNLREYRQQQQQQQQQPPQRFDERYDNDNGYRRQDSSSRYYPSSQPQSQRRSRSRSKSPSHTRKTHSDKFVSRSRSNSTSKPRYRPRSRSR